MMTIQEAIDELDALKPNSYTAAQKIKWLSDIDLLAYNEILSTHEDAPETAFTGYASVADTATRLLIPAPYTDVYRWYLESRVDLANAETGKYNNSITLFNNAYLTFTDRYNREHAPLQNTAAFHW